MTDKDNLHIKIESEGFIRASLDQNGKPRKFIIIKTPESKRFESYVMINRDLDLVIEAIGDLKLINKPIIQQSLLFFSIVTYAKTFTSNNGTRSTLNFDDIFKGATEEVKNEHNRIMDLRNGYVAHAGSLYDNCLTIGTIFELNNTIIGIDVNSKLTHAVNMPPKLNDFALLCSYVKDKVLIKVSKSQKKLFDYVSNLEGNELFGMIIMPTEANMYTMIEVENNSSSGYKKYSYELITKT